MSKIPESACEGFPGFYRIVAGLFPVQNLVEVVLLGVLDISLGGFVVCRG